MKLSQLDSTKNLKVLAYGPSGSGKTIFTCSFPGPVYVFDFDGKISSAANFYQGTPQLDMIDYDAYTPKVGDTTDRPFVRYFTKLVELEKLAKEGNFPYATVGLDSLTLYTDQMLKEIIAQNPGVKRQASPTTPIAALQDYMILTSHFKNMLVRLLQLPCNVVVTAHIQTNKDELTGEIHREPLLPGKLPSFLPVMFEEVYRTYRGEKDYMAQTQTNPQYNARSQIRGLPLSIKLGYAELANYLPKPKPLTAVTGA